MQGIDDLTLLREAERGQPLAQEELTRRLLCVPRFLAALNERMGVGLGREELEDLTQEVLAIVWSKRTAFGGESRLSTWCYGICRLEIRNAGRRKQRDRELVVEISGSFADASLGGDVQGEAGRLRRAVEELEPESGAIVRSKHFDGLTFDQIAARTRLSVSAVKRRYYKALDELRRRLEASLGEMHG